MQIPDLNPKLSNSEYEEYTRYSKEYSGTFLTRD